MGQSTVISSTDAVNRPMQLDELDLRLRRLADSAEERSSGPLGYAPAPADFNRHASSHRLAPEQYTEHNALVGLMLVVPFLREVDSLMKVIAARTDLEHASPASV